MENDYKNLKVEINSEDFSIIEEVAKKSNRTKNEIINIFIKYGLEHYMDEK